MRLCPRTNKDLSKGRHCIPFWWQGCYYVDFEKESGFLSEVVSELEQRKLS